MNDNSWKAVFDKYKIHEHNLEKELFLISAEQIKQATTHFKKTNEKKFVILCKQDSREIDQRFFIDNEVFLLPTKNAGCRLCRLHNNSEVNQSC